MTDARAKHQASSMSFVLTALDNRELWIAAFGSACALATWFPGRVGVSRNFGLSEYAFIEDVASVAFLLLMSFVWAVKPNLHIGQNKFAMVAIGAGSLLVYIAQFSPMTVAPTSIFFAISISTLYKIASIMLLLLWIERAAECGTRKLVLFMGAGFLCLAVIQILFIVLQSLIAQLMFAFSRSS